MMDATFLPSLSERGPANGRAIKRPSPSAAATIVTSPMSEAPHCFTKVSFTATWPNTEHPIPWMK